MRLSHSKIAACLIVVVISGGILGSNDEKSSQVVSAVAYVRTHGGEAASDVVFERLSKAIKSLPPSKRLQGSILVSGCGMYQIAAAVDSDFQLIHHGRGPDTTVDGLVHETSKWTYSDWLAYFFQSAFNSAYLPWLKTAKDYTETKWTTWKGRRLPLTIHHKFETIKVEELRAFKQIRTWAVSKDPESELSYLVRAALSGSDRQKESELLNAAYRTDLDPLDRPFVLWMAEDLVKWSKSASDKDLFSKLIAQLRQEVPQALWAPSKAEDFFVVIE